MTEQWVLKPSSELLLRQVDDFVACYSLLSGETHILDAFPATILRLLESSPATVAQIEADLNAEMGSELDLHDRVRSVLDQCARLQLLDMQGQ